jgi:hypothetical protein
MRRPFHCLDCWICNLNYSFDMMVTELKSVTQKLILIANFMNVTIVTIY